MKTDELFYEVFRFSPDSLLELVQLKVSGAYRFESITVKTTEKRLDGYFKNLDETGPDIFLEIQGYRDNNIYWRLFREICAFHEERKTDHRTFAAVVLFLDIAFDPGNPPLVPAAPNQLLRCDLVECLKNIRDNATPLVALKPLTLSDKAELPSAVGEWKAGIDAMALSEARKKALEELLEYAILQRFQNLTLEEVRKMIQLTPLEESLAVKELVQQGVEKGVEQGMKKGQVIGQIQLIQRWLKRPQTPSEHLAERPMEELSEMLAGLEGELAKHSTIQ
jgi:predicted transposase YdaD